VDSDLVHEPGGEELLGDVRAHHADALLARGLAGLRERALDSIGDEREDRGLLQGGSWVITEARDVTERAAAAALRNSSQERHPGIVVDIFLERF